MRTEEIKEVYVYVIVGAEGIEEMVKDVLAGIEPVSCFEDWEQPIQTYVDLYKLSFEEYIQIKDRLKEIGFLEIDNGNNQIVVTHY